MKLKSFQDIRSEESVMKKFTAVLLTTVCLAGLSACSGYPSWVPDWAQIGAGDTEEASS